MAHGDEPVEEPAQTPEARLQRYRETGDRRLRNAVVEEHRWLAVVIAQEYCTGGEPLDDLIQVACVALLKAAERFDPRFGVEFKTYGAVTVRGELRRYYCDATWSVRVPRRLQELRYEVRSAVEVLSARLQRSPDTAEVAEYLHVHPDEIIDCLCAERNYRSLTLDADDNGSLARDRRGTNEAALASVESGESFRTLLGVLPDRLRRIVEMRFVDEMKQSDIADVIGVSQVQVSRLLRTAMRQLRAALDEQREAAAKDRLPAASSDRHCATAPAR